MIWNCLRPRCTARFGNQTGPVSGVSLSLVNSTNSPETCYSLLKEEDHASIDLCFDTHDYLHDRQFPTVLAALYFISVGINMVSMYFGHGLKSKLDKGVIIVRAPPAPPTTAQTPQPENEGPTRS